MLYMFAASLLSAALMLALMPVCITRLKRLKFGQTMYQLGPQSHLSKQGTPNMGGIVTGPVTALSALALCLALNARYPARGGFWTLDNALWALLFVTLGAMAIGFADDYIKDIRKEHEGLKPLQKVAGQVIVGLAFSLWAYQFIGSEVLLPFTDKTWDLGLWYIPLITLTVLFMTNSANLHDGVDGLLSAVTVTGMAAFAAIALLFALAQGNAQSLLPQHTAAVFAFALAGASAGFLRFNRHPAQVFMGDTGSMFIGGAMVGVAVILRCEFLLLTICFTSVMSSASVILQRYYFKLTHGKRIFKMSPIHHHFEMCGMSEKGIVALYACITLILSAVAIWSVRAWF